MRERGRDGRIVALHVPDRKDPLGPAGRLEHPLSLLRVRRDRLLDEDVHAPPERFDREIGVRGSGGRDRDEIDPVQERLQGVEEPEAQLPGGPLAGARIRVVCPRERHPLDPGPGARVVRAEMADADHPDANRRHRTMPRSELRTNSTNSWTSGYGFSSPWIRSSACETLSWER